MLHICEKRMMTTRSVDAKSFRDTLGHFASGITIISGMVEEVPVGFTCQSFISVSLDPPLVSFSVMKSSKSWPRVGPQGRFAINVLSAEQAHLSNIFARSECDRWSGVSWTTSAVHRNPLIERSLFWLDCSLFAIHEAGDHWIVIAKVDDLCEPAVGQDHSPLIYYKGRYVRIAPTNFA